jgi:hypothetical protein
MTHLTPGIAELLARQEAAEGLDFSTLKKGTILKVRTVTSEYVMFIMRDGEVRVAGGRHFPQPTKATFNGSTWGGSMLKPGWIGQGMSMEFTFKTNDGLKTVLSSGVQAVKVIPEEGITFLLEWVPQACTA